MRWDHHLQWLQTSCVERDLVIDQRTEDVEYSCCAYRRGRVEIVQLLRRATCEVDLCTAVPGVDANGRLDLCAVVQRQGELTVIQSCDHAPYRFLGVVLHMFCISLHNV